MFSFNTVISWLLHAVIRGGIQFTVILLGLFFSAAAMNLQGGNYRGKLIAFVGVILTAITWCVVLMRPSLFWEIDGRQGYGLPCFMIIFEPPFAATLAIIYLLWPKLKDSDLGSSGPMSGYFQIVKSEFQRRPFFVALGSGFVNAVCLLLIAARHH